MLLISLLHEVKNKLIKKAAINPQVGPSMHEYYQSLHDAEQAGYQAGYLAGRAAGEMNKSIHEMRRDIAKHVGE